MKRPCQRLLSSWIALALASSSVTSLLADPSKPLPKGRNLDRGVGRPDPLARPPERVAREACFLDFSHALNHRGAFSQSGKSLFYMANLPRKDQTSPDPTPKFTLYEIDTASQIGKPIVGLKLPGNHLMFTHGDPVSGASIVMFPPENMGCSKGPAQIITITTREMMDQKKRAIRTHGDYATLQAPGRFLLFDTTKRAILETDIISYQTRPMIAKVPPEHRPIFAFPQDQRYIAFHKAEGMRGLVDTKGGEAGRKLKLADGDKVAWDQQGKFVIVRPTKTSNSIEIQEIPGWSGSKAAKTFHFPLKAIFNNRSAHISIHVDKQLAIAQGASAFEKLRWRQAFLFNYAKSEEVAAITPQRNNYIGEVMFSGSGDYVLVEERSEKSHTTMGLRLFHTTKQEWLPIRLIPPSGSTKK